MRNWIIYCLYPVWTIIFASQASILEENLSIAGNLENRHFLFVIWACTTLYVLAIGYKDCIKHSLHQKILRNFSVISSLTFMIAVLLPYKPEYYPNISDWHVSLSFVALISMLGCVGMMLISLTFTHRHLTYFNLFYILICMICLIIFFGFGIVNSLVEIFAAITTAIYLDQLAKYLTNV